MTEPGLVGTIMVANLGVQAVQVAINEVVAAVTGLNALVGLCKGCALGTSTK